MMRAGLAIGVVVVLAGVGWLFWSSYSTGRADATDAKQVALGETIYRDQCASCHGAKLEGQPDWRSRGPNGRLLAPPHDESGHTWHHADALLFGITKDSLVPPLAPDGYESDMPAFAALLSDAEIWAVLAFIKSRWSADTRERQNRLNQ